MPYASLLLPDDDIKELVVVLKNELEAIGNAFNRPLILHLDVAHAEPAKPRDGMVVLADGTDWNPGSGEGYYGYYGASWKKLG